MSLNREQYEYLAKCIREKHTIGWAFADDKEVAVYEGEVIAKERARKGKSGGMFTPPATRAFEKSVREWGAQHFTPVSYPIKVDLIIWEEGTLEQVRTGALTYNMKQDLDNKVKAVMDGLNKVAYKDDRQIAQITATRKFALEGGFYISIHRCGLSKTEYSNFLKFL